MPREPIRSFEAIQIPEDVLLLEAEQNDTANTIWFESLAIQSENSKELALQQGSFINAYIKYLNSIGNPQAEDAGQPVKSIPIPAELLKWSDEHGLTNKTCSTLLNVFAVLRKKDPSEESLYEEVTEFTNSIIPKDLHPKVYPRNDDFLNLSRTVWGIPEYLQRIMHRQEALTEKDLILWWKSNLRTEDDIESADPSLQKVKDAERSLYASLENHFIDTLNDLFKDKIPDVFSTDIATNSITELQRIWQKEKGTTISSWQKKHWAYIKLMLLYGVMSVMGTINFPKKQKNRNLIQKMIDKYFKPFNVNGKPLEVNQKQIPSVVMKVLKYYLSDKTEPDPRRVRDFIRLRIAVNFPEGVIEDGNIDEIQTYVVSTISYVLDVFGNTYSHDRLRNSYKGKGINENTGKLHKAVHVTLYVAVDNQPGCPEKIPVEFQVMVQRTSEEQEEDDEQYKEKKRQDIKRLLGINVTFFDYINHVTDMFMREFRLPEEKKGGPCKLSKMEMAAVDLLQVLAGTDEETNNHIRECCKSGALFYEQKFSKAITSIINYWQSKAALFMKNKLETISKILIDSEAPNKPHSQALLKYETRMQIKDVENMVAEIIENVNQPSLLPDSIEKLKQAVSTLSFMPAVQQRINTQIRLMNAYHTVHYHQTDLNKLVQNAYHGLNTIFPKEETAGVIN